MDRNDAVQVITKAYKRLYKSQVNAAKAIGLSHITFNRALNSDCRPIPRQMLEMAGIEEVPPDQVKYRRIKK